MSYSISIELRTYSVKFAFLSVKSTVNIDRFLDKIFSNILFTNFENSLFDILQNDKLDFF